MELLSQGAEAVSIRDTVPTFFAGSTRALLSTAGVT